MSDSKTTPVTGGVSEPRPVVIDADPGVDDVQAIAIALSADRRGEIRVLGITITAGNSPLKQCIRNARRALAIFDRLDIPIYAGAHCSLVKGAMDPTDLYNGKNGLGGVHFEDPLPEVKQQKEHAVSALVRLAKEHKGKLCILALAPLTNIAMAIRMDKEFIHNIADLYIMGGNYTGMGNTTPSGEFNFYTDPEAAYIVLSSVPKPVTIACWELCLNHGIDMAWREKVLGAADSAAARFFNATEAERFSRRKFSPHWVSCDPVAAALLVRPQVALQTNRHHATVELQGEYTRGQMVVDRRGPHASITSRLSVNIVESLDIELYKKMMLDAFGHPDIAF